MNEITELQREFYELSNQNRPINQRIIGGEGIIE